jgi:hypothetical protein
MMEICLSDQRTCGKIRCTLLRRYYMDLKLFIDMRLLIAFAAGVLCGGVAVYIYHVVRLNQLSSANSMKSHKMIKLQLGVIKTTIEAVDEFAALESEMQALFDNPAISSLGPEHQARINSIISLLHKRKALLASLSYNSAKKVNRINKRITALIDEF